MFNGQKLLFTIVVWSEQCVENENRVKGVKRLKLDLVRIIEYFNTTKYGSPLPPRVPRARMTMTPVTSVSYGTSPSPPSFWRENCNVWRRKDGAGYFVASKGIFVHKYPLILCYSDWLVLEL